MTPQAHSNLCRTCLWKLNPELTDREQQEAAMQAKGSPGYPPDLSDPDWMSKVPKYTTFGPVRTHIPCINWFDNNPFDFLKPKPTKKATKPKKPKKQTIPYDLPNEPQKPPWGVDPWDKPKDPYGPWRGKNPYDYKKWKDEYESK